MASPLPTPAHPDATWNPAFRPDSNTSSPPNIALGTAACLPRTTYLHNVTPSTTTKFASAGNNNHNNDDDMKEISLLEGRDLEAGVVSMGKVAGVRGRLVECSKWGFYAVVLCLTLGMGTCYTLGN